MSNAKIKISKDKKIVFQGYVLTQYDLSVMLEKELRRIEMLVDTHEYNKRSIFYNGRSDDLKRSHDIEIAVMTANRIRSMMCLRTNSRLMSS